MSEDFHAKLNEGIGKLMPLVGQVMCHVRHHISAACERLGYQLTPEEAGTLMIIYECDGLPQSMLANILGKDKAAVTRMMNALVKSGLVKRMQDEQDRRIVRAFISEEGKQAFVDISPMLKATSDKALDNVSEDDFVATQRVLKGIISNLGKY